MTSTLLRLFGPVRASLLASTLAVALAQSWSPTLIGGGFSSADDPDSPYFSGQVAPPSWQGRPDAIR